MLCVHVCVCDLLCAICYVEYQLCKINCMESVPSRDSHFGLLGTNDLCAQKHKAEECRGGIHRAGRVVYLRMEVQSGKIFKKTQIGQYRLEFFQVERGYVENLGDIKGTRILEGMCTQLFLNCQIKSLESHVVREQQNEAAERPIQGHIAVKS